MWKLSIGGDPDACGSWHHCGSTTIVGASLWEHHCGNPVYIPSASQKVTCSFGRQFPTTLRTFSLKHLGLSARPCSLATVVYPLCVLAKPETLGSSENLRHKPQTIGGCELVDNWSAVGQFWGVKCTISEGPPLEWGTVAHTGNMLTLKALHLLLSFPWLAFPEAILLCFFGSLPKGTTCIQTFSQALH